MKEQEQVNIGQASLVILQLIAMGPVSPKDIMVLEIIDQSVNLQLTYPVDDIWSVKSCQAMAIALQSLPCVPPVGVSSNGVKERGLAVVSYNSR
jgi:hypothetical protein